MMSAVRFVCVCMLAACLALSSVAAKKEKQDPETSEPQINPHHLPAPDGSTISIPKRIVFPDPPYPDSDQARRMGAYVTLGIDIDADGRVAEAIVLHCTVQNLGFEEAARSGVLSWQFEPAVKLKNGLPIKDTPAQAVFMTIRIVFPPKQLILPAQRQ